MKDTDRLEKPALFEAFIKSAQYFVRLKTQQDVWEHLAKFVTTYFPAEWVAFVARDSAGAVRLHHSTLKLATPEDTILTADARTVIGEVLESGFLASRVIQLPAPSMTVFVPIMQEYQAKEVMLIGHKSAEALPKDLVNTYLALAGLAGTAIERLHNEQELNQYRAYLEDLVQARTAELAQAVQALRASEETLKEEARRRDDFLAVLGHELRNPLGPIRNAVHLLHKAAPTPERAQQACGIVERQVAHMVRLVDDLLDVSRVKRGKVELRREDIDLVETVRSVAADYQPVLNEHRLILDLDLPSAPVRLHADRARVIQIVGNLLHNATKFTDAGGKIRISARSDGLGWAEVRVRDTGTGIDPDMLTKVFDPFMQVKETVGRSPSGLGLGLALVRGLVELHGGAVTAHSAGPGLGSEFIVRLPLTAVAAQSAGETPAAVTCRQPARPRRILIVEDSRDAAESLQLLLELSGHTVEVAFDGQTGLSKAHSFEPEVVLCDIGLPGTFDGYDVARKIKSTPQLQKAYLMALSGFGQPEDKQRAQQAGFDMHVTKPVDPEVLDQLLAGLPVARL